MKIIPKKQKGGSFDSFFTTYVPLSMQKSRTHTYRESEQRTSKSSESSDDSKGKLTEKDFFDMLKGINGLPNEMSSIVGNLISTFQMSNLTGLDPGNLATQYLQNLYQIKVAAQNKETYDKAVEQANKNGAMAEPAISIDGKIIVQKNDGQITKVSLDSYFKNNGEFTPLTVSNLANLRAYSPELAYKPEAFSIITNSMGFEAFQNLLSKATQSLGTSEYTRSGMFSAEGQASKGLELLSTLRKDDRVQAIGSVTAEGLYKYKIIDKNQLGQIKALTSYISTVLPDRAKTWAALKVGTPNKEKATEDLIFQYLISGNTQSHTFDIDYQGSMDKVQGTTQSSSSKNEDSAKMTFLTALQNGYGGGKETRTLNFGNNTNFEVTGTAYGAFLDQNQKTLSNVTLSDLLSKTGIQGITNPQSITFGNNVINSNLFSKIAIQDNGGFWAVLPCIKYGNKVTPNFTLLNKFDKVVQQVINETNENTSPEEKQALLENKLQRAPELQELLTMSGKLDPSKFQAFFIVDGLASDQNFTFRNSDGSKVSGSSNPLIWETTDSSDIEYFQNVTKDKDFDPYDNVLGDIFGMYDTLYKSKVFIPIQTNNRLAAILFSGQKIKDSNAREIEGEYQRFQVSSKMNTPSSKYLY